MTARVTNGKRPPGKKRGAVTPALDKREAFVQAYMGEAQMNGKRAATIAGFSPERAHVTASQLLDEPAVQERIKEIKLERAAESKITAEMLTARLMEIADGRMLATIGVSEGVPIVGEPRHADRIRAIELVAKLNGLDVLRVQAVEGEAATPEHRTRLRALLDRLDETERAIDATPRSPGEGGGE